MNELGLTRESVREEMMRIVEQTITKAFNDSAVDARIERLIEAKIQTALNPYRYGSGDLVKLVKAEVAKEAQEQVRSIVKERVAVTLTLLNEGESVTTPD